MGKELNYTEDSPRQTKLGDTTTSLKLALTENGNNIDVTGITNITVKLGDTSNKVVSEIGVNPTTLAADADSVITVPIDSAVMSKLKAGYYGMEAWVTNSKGINIFPSEGALKFNVNESYGETL